MPFQHLGAADIVEVRTVIEQHRNNYSYPGMYIDLPNDVDWNSPTHPCNLQGPRGETDHAFERHIYQALTADEAKARFIGVARVVYWGYANAGYRENRVQKVWDGRADLVRIAEALEMASQCAHEERFDDAIGCLDGIPQVQRIPFASKVIAFLNPAMAGVYDNKINNFLAHLQPRTQGVLREWLLPYAPNLHGPIGNARSAIARERYQQWCTFLQNNAFALNAMGSTWGGKHQWRAVDVERAIFDAANANP